MSTWTRRHRLSADWEGHYERVAKRITTYRNRLTAYLRDAIISRDDYGRHALGEQSYVPFFRVMDEDNRPEATAVLKRTQSKYQDRSATLSTDQVDH